MPDSRSRRFATWAFSFKPLGGNLRIAAATHISAFFCPEKQKSGKNASSRFSRAGEPKNRAASRRAFGGPHPAGEPKPRKSVTSFESLSLGEVFYPRNHGKRSLRPDEVFVTGAIRSKASSRRRHLLQEPREAKPSARGARNSGNPQPGSPLPAIVARPQKLSCKPQPCRDLRGVPQNEDDKDQHWNPVL